MLASETLHSPARAAPAKPVSAAAVTTAEIGAGFWSCGFDRDGVCFEMTKISRSTAKDYMFDYGAYSLKDLTVTDFGDAVYYYNEETCDGGILLVH